MELTSKLNSTYISCLKEDIVIFSQKIKRQIPNEFHPYVEQILRKLINDALTYDSYTPKTVLTDVTNIVNDKHVKCNSLHRHLQERIKDLKGDWIRKNSGYEEEACNELGFTCQTKRYWDCEYNQSYIEIKKGRSIWLDEVRYCELFMGINDECKQKTTTIFLIPSKDKHKIEKIFIIDTQKIFNELKINKEWAEHLLLRNLQTKRSLNCQQSLTLKDVSTLADYVIAI